jgi:hypothetical protein
VVKRGSKTWVFTSGDLPSPVSRIASRTWGPACRKGCRATWRSSIMGGLIHLLLVLAVIAVLVRVIQGRRVA